MIYWVKERCSKANKVTHFFRLILFFHSILWIWLHWKPLVAAKLCRMYKYAGAFLDFTVKLLSAAPTPMLHWCVCVCVFKCVCETFCKWLSNIFLIKACDAYCDISCFMKNKPMRRDKAVILLCFVWERPHEGGKKERDHIWYCYYFIDSYRQHVMTGVLIVVTLCFLYSIFFLNSKIYFVQKEHSIYKMVEIISHSIKSGTSTYFYAYLWIWILWCLLYIVEIIIYVLYNICVVFICYIVVGTCQITFGFIIKQKFRLYLNCMSLFPYTGKVQEKYWGFSPSI